MWITLLLTTVMMLACGAPRAEVATATAHADKDFQEREEINRTFQLSPGARVEISTIRGPVEISNTDSATAEVQIIRTARTRADLEHHKIGIEQTGDSLVVKGIDEHDRANHIRVNHHVILRLPRRVNLSVGTISGSLKTGDVEGQLVVNSISGAVTTGDVGGKLRLQSISGNVDIGNVGGAVKVNSVSGRLRVGQVNGALDVMSVSGSVNATLGSLSTEGIHVKSVSGSVEIGFKSDVNADFSAVSFTGQVYLDVPNVVRDSETHPSYVRARIGAGGTPISIVSVSGDIRLTRS